MSLHLNPEALEAVRWCCLFLGGTVLVRTMYQVLQLRHRARTAAQWDRLVRDAMLDAVNRNRAVRVQPEEFTINPSTK